MAIISIPDSLGGVSIPGITNVPGGPLGVLFGTSRYDIAAYKFPKDLSSATKGHYIHFTINQVEPMKATGAVVNQTRTAVESALGGNWKDAALETFGIGQTAAQSIMGVAKGDVTYTERKKTVIKTIALYMPDTVDFQYNSQYGKTSLKEVAQAVGSAVGLKGTTSAIAGIVDSPVTKLLMQTAGLAINPREQVLFDGIDFRSYQLAFTFTPTSRDEAIEVTNIVREFRSAMAPTINSGKAGMFYDIPNTFDIDFLFNGKRNNYVNKVAESVLTNIDVNYAPNGWSAHTDGAPVQTTITMSFQELDLIDKTKIRQGY